MLNRVDPKKVIPVTIRIILTLLLIWGAYTETGKWTALCLLLIFMAIEALSLAINKRRIRELFL